jgi:hypothetical protein
VSEDEKVVVETKTGDEVSVEVVDPKKGEVPEKVRKLAGRKLDRLARESRFRVLPPGSKWKRRDGTVASAGPRYGQLPKLPGGEK